MRFTLRSDVVRRLLDDAAVPAIKRLDDAGRLCPLRRLAGREAPLVRGRLVEPPAPAPVPAPEALLESASPSAATLRLALPMCT